MSSSNPLLKPAPASQPSVPSGDLPLCQAGAFNVYASMPCPLKVRFKSEFEQFMAQHPQLPIYCADAADGTPMHLEQQLAIARGPEDYPDVLVNTRQNVVFSSVLRPTFFAPDTGIYVGVTQPEQFARLPASYQQVAKQFNLGFLAFGRWQLVWDQSLADRIAPPTCWADLAKPEYRGLISAHGCHGTIGATGLLIMLHEQIGDAGLIRFAENIGRLAHFSEIIKGIGSKEEARTPFNILPYPAAMQIPTKKPAVMLELRDGPLLTNTTLFVRRDRLEQAAPVLEFFWGEAFHALLARGGLQTPAEVDWSQPYTGPSWESLAQSDYDARVNAITEVFQQGLDPECEVRV